MSRPNSDTPTKTLPAQAYDVLEDMIVSQVLKPGSAVTEDELASRVGIGRTPVNPHFVCRSAQVWRAVYQRAIQIKQHRPDLFKPVWHLLLAPTQI